MSAAISVSQESLSFESNNFNCRGESKGFWSFMGLRSTSHNHIAEAEQGILEGVKTKIDRFFTNVKVGEHRYRLWTLKTAEVKENTENKTPLVLIHGMGGGVGMWGRNIDALSERRPFYAFDLLGFGRSSRPKLPTEPEACENELVESIEAWRKRSGLDEMILVGHSFGGYLASAYTLKYPGKVRHLVLADPWGFPGHDPEEVGARTSRIPLRYRPFLWIAKNISPLGIVRFAGSAAPGLISRVRPSFQAQFGEGIYKYIYHCNAQYPSGELAFKALSRDLGWARRPMVPRLAKLEASTPVTFIYGDHTWMDKTTGDALKEKRNGRVDVVVVPEAGHHVYADNPQYFNEQLLSVCDKVDNGEYDDENRTK